MEQEAQRQQMTSQRPHPAAAAAERALRDAAAWPQARPALSPLRLRPVQLAPPAALLVPQLRVAARRQRVPPPPPRAPWPRPRRRRAPPAAPLRPRVAARPPPRPETPTRSLVAPARRASPPPRRARPRTARPRHRRRRRSRSRALLTWQPPRQRPLGASARRFRAQGPRREDARWPGCPAAPPRHRRDPERQPAREGRLRKAAQQRKALPGRAARRRCRLAPRSGAPWARDAREGAVARAAAAAAARRQRNGAPKQQRHLQLEHRAAAARAAAACLPTRAQPPPPRPARWNNSAERQRAS